MGWMRIHDRFVATWSQALAGFVSTAAAATGAWLLAPGTGYLSLLLFLAPTLVWAYLFGALGGLASTVVVLPLSLFLRVGPGPFSSTALGFVFWGFCALTGALAGFSFSRGSAERSLREEIHQLRRSLHGAQKEFKHLVHRLPIPYLRIDTAGTIRSCNAMGEQVLGVAFGTLRGSSLSRFLPKDTELDDTGLIRFLTGDSLELMTAYGEPTPIDWRAEVIKDSRGKITGFSLFGADKADIQRLEREVMEAAVRVESETGDRRAFIHAVREEIIGFAKRIIALSGGLMKENSPNDQQAARIRTIASDLTETLRSLSEMFEPDRGFRLREDGFDLRATLEELRGNFAQSYRLGILDFDFRVSDNVPSYVWGDRARFRRALRHAFGYVTNSMRAGRIFIEARCDGGRTSETVLRVHTSASDPTQTLFDSVSMNQDDAWTVGERIRRLGVPFTAMKSLLDQLGGDLAVYSSQDVSTLTFEFPFRVIERPDVNTRNEQHGPRAALVGRNDDLTEALRHIGYSITLEGDADMVIVDVGRHPQHVVQGSAFDEDLDETFRVALGIDEPTTQADYLAGGFDAYVRNDGDPRDVAAEIDEVYWNQSSPHQSEPANLETLELKTNVSERVLRIFLNDMPEKLAQLEQAMRGRDLAEAAGILHSIADYVSVTRMRVIATRCADLEKAARQNRYLELMSEYPEVKRLIEKLLGNIRDVLQSPTGS